jgi:hypothetical protein
MTKTQLKETTESVGILVLTAVFGFIAFEALTIIMEAIK